MKALIVKYPEVFKVYWRTSHLTASKELAKVLNNFDASFAAGSNDRRSATIDGEHEELPGLVRRISDMKASEIAVPSRAIKIRYTPPHRKRTGYTHSVGHPSYPKYKDMKEYFSASIRLKCLKERKKRTFDGIEEEEMQEMVDDLWREVKDRYESIVAIGYFVSRSSVYTKEQKTLYYAFDKIQNNIERVNSSSLYYLSGSPGWDSRGKTALLEKGEQLIIPAALPFRIKREGRQVESVEETEEEGRDGHLYRIFTVK